MQAPDTPARLFFEGQVGHAIGLGLLLAALYAATGLPGFSDGEFLGISTTGWAALTVGNAIVHQVFVWVCWRAELHSKSLTRIFGANVFASYAALFTVFMVGRVGLAFALGWANHGTLPIEATLGCGVSLVLLGPSLWLAYSIKRYFTFRRAFGIDHFDERYRGAGLETRGIFRFVPNAMYTAGFLIIWIPAFAFQSVTAVAVAAFCHLYIWVHYFCTEKPDMKRIYK